MRRLVLIAMAAAALPGAAVAQTWGQPVYSAQIQTYGSTYGRPHGGPTSHGPGGYGYGYGYGDPRAYRPPVRYGHGYDRGGRYGYSTGQWTRWSSPPGRGYHDVYGYNDDRAPRGKDYGHYPDRDCYCGVGAYLYDR